MLKKFNSYIAVIIVCIGLLMTNIFLVVQNLRYRSELSQVHTYKTEEGYKFSELNLKDLSGNEERSTLNDGKQKTLLLHFNSKCDYCVQQYPYWKDVIARLDTSKWRVLAVTREGNLDEVKAHLAKFDLTSVKAMMINPADASKARMGYTPMTIIVDEKGEVEKVWSGLWKSREVENNMKYFESAQ